MAGRARYQALTDELSRRVIDTFDPDPEDNPQPSTLDYVCHWMECGKTAKALAADLSNALPFECDYAMLMRYLRNTFGEQAAEQAIDASRTRASHSLAEDALDLIDNADRDSSSAVSKAAAQARSRQWMAEKYNPSRFGQKVQQSVSISVSALHLEALRARPNRVTGSPLGAIAGAEAQEIVASNVLPVAQLAESSSHTSD